MGRGHEMPAAHTQEKMDPSTPRDSLTVKKNGTYSCQPNCPKLWKQISQTICNICYACIIATEIVTFNRACPFEITSVFSMPSGYHTLNKKGDKNKFIEIIFPVFLYFLIVLFASITRKGELLYAAHSALNTIIAGSRTLDTFKKNLAARGPR